VISCVVEVRLSTFPLFYFAYVSVNVSSVFVTTFGVRDVGHIYGVVVTDTPLL
jgi:hypothetical protein